MTAWFKVTRYRSNKTYYVNLAQVQTVVPSDEEDGGCYIIFAGDENRIHVADPITKFFAEEDSTARPNG